MAAKYDSNARPGPSFAASFAIEITRNELGMGGIYAMCPSEHTSAQHPGTLQGLRDNREVQVIIKK